MDFNNPQTIEEVVLKVLSSKALTGEFLLVAAQKLKPGFTKQALYQLLRKLVNREIVVKQGKIFSLSQVWILRMNDFFSLAHKQYGLAEQGGNDFLALSDGDKISYSFKNPAESDSLWGHAYSTLGGLLSQTEPVYTYNPHEWFFIARKETEVYIFNKLRELNQQVWLIAGGNTVLDRHISKYFDGKILQYHMATEEIFEARNYYLNIFGDYIIEARIDERTAEKVDSLYEQTTVWSESVEQKIADLVSEGKTQISISRNKKKAEKLKRIFTPYFYKI